jgi:hypothetical protein
MDQTKRNQPSKSKPASERSSEHGLQSWNSEPMFGSTKQKGIHEEFDYKR